ncbi:MAG TPA: glycerol-3-phosphate 1-O-acyltransferase PlsY [Pyrinomonadaceae bacterium]|jgi:glycerol-3-phosphate acyltransferase PlsY|nr:glycerol-3-phosphate 1-O-acyltransferase PlsY [Pyrinomonadaceae bacterium]
MLHALVVTLAYLLGSIPFGYLIVRAGGRGDVRETGSGGTGATNVTRRAGKGAGLLTLLLDALKGAAAVLLARLILTEGFGVNWWVAAAAVAAVAGHCFPVWLGFRGGKGVATGLGVFALLAPLALLCVLPFFLLVVWATRYVSLGSIVAATLVPLAVWALGALGYVRREELLPVLTAASLGGALIIFMHRANIGRLLRGEESRLKL